MAASQNKTGERKQKGERKAAKSAAMAETIFIRNNIE